MALFETLVFVTMESTLWVRCSVANALRVHRIRKTALCSHIDLMNSHPRRNYGCWVPSSCCNSVGIESLQSTQGRRGLGRNAFFHHVLQCMVQIEFRWEACKADTPNLMQQRGRSQLIILLGSARAPRRMGRSCWYCKGERKNQGTDSGEMVPAKGIRLCTQIGKYIQVRKDRHSRKLVWWRPRFHVDPKRHGDVGFVGH